MSSHESSISSTVGLAVVGGGNMGAALLGGLVESETFSASEIAVVEVLATRRSELMEMFPTVLVTATVPPCRAAVLAVKPGDIPTAAAAASEAGATRILSIAAGVRLATIEAAVGENSAVLRAMPNTPALVRKGASAVAAGASADEVDLEWAESVLSAVGIVDRMPESALDAFTGLAGSGPAYLFLVAEALIDAGVAEGLARPVCERVVRQLFVGSSMLLDGGSGSEGGGDPARLRAMVTSPGGTTAAGLGALEHHALRSAFGDAVRAATVRSRELG